MDGDRLDDDDDLQVICSCSSLGSVPCMQV